MHNPGFIRNRRMQPRYKYKHHHHSSLRAATIPTPRNILCLVTIVVVASVWFHHLGFFSDPFLPSQTRQNRYTHGTVPVDRVVWHEGGLDPNNGTTHPTHHSRPVSRVARRSLTDRYDSTTPQHINIQVAAFDEHANPTANQKPSPAPILVETAAGTENAAPAPAPAHSPPTLFTPAAKKLASAPQTLTETAIKHEKEQNAAPVAVKPKSLKDVLNFTTTTAVNFMHFHKTGGVSFKTSLHKFYHQKIKANGQRVLVRDACYTRQGVKDDPSKPTFTLWRCDWEPLREMTEEDRNKHDFVFGHQFWGNGAGTLLNKRDLRSFTILRHPFDRKVSFYYHFFVREVGRKEEDVTFEDIRDFLLYDKLTIVADLGRDLGPNYMAGRMLSDGRRGFVGNSHYGHYEVAQEAKSAVAEEAKTLLRSYVFVGLQKESGAAKCMLRKVVESFNEVNGISNDGVEHIDEDAAVLNTGSYSMAADDIWKKLSEADRIVFDKKERVDLLIYEEGERLFRDHARLFGCEDRVLNMRYK